MERSRSDVPRDNRAPMTRDEIIANLSDLDFAIFAKLPDEGTKLGYHPLMKTAKHLLGELNADLPPDTPREALLTMGELNGRMRSLHIAGLVVQVSRTLHSRGDGWQRTQDAVALLKKHGGGQHGE